MFIDTLQFGGGRFIAQLTCVRPKVDEFYHWIYTEPAEDVDYDLAFSHQRRNRRKSVKDEPIGSIVHKISALPEPQPLPVKTVLARN